MARHRMVNGNKVWFTAEEELARDAEEAQAVIDRQAEEDARAAKAADKASAEQKLKDLGLDDEEIKELTGA